MFWFFFICLDFVLKSEKLYSDSNATFVRMSAGPLKKLVFEPEPDSVTNFSEGGIVLQLRRNTKWHTAMLDILVQSPDVNLETLGEKIYVGFQMSRPGSTGMTIHLQLVEPSEIDPRIIARTLSVLLRYYNDERTNFLFEVDPRLFNHAFALPTKQFCSMFTHRLVSSLNQSEWNVFVDTVSMNNLCHQLTPISLHKNGYLFVCYETPFEASTICALALGNVGEHNSLELSAICHRRGGAGILLFEKVLQFATPRHFKTVTISAASSDLETYVKTYGLEKAGPDKLAKQIKENAYYPIGLEVVWKDAYPLELVHIFNKYGSEARTVFAIEDRDRAFVCSSKVLLSKDGMDLKLAIVYCRLTSTNSRISGAAIETLSHQAESFGLTRLGSDADVIVCVAFPVSISTNRTDIWENMGYIHENGALKLKICQVHHPLTKELVDQFGEVVQSELLQPPQATTAGYLIDQQDDDNYDDGAGAAAEAEPEHKTSCESGAPWVPASIPLYQSDPRNLVSGRLTNLYAAIGIDGILNTKQNRLTIIAGVRMLSLTQTAVLGALRAWLGFAPVSEKVKYALPGGFISPDEDAYFGKLLSWGEENRPAFQRVLQGLFDVKMDSASNLKIRQADITDSNCLELVHIPWMCAKYRREHKRGFEYYMVHHSTPVSDNILHWNMPKYNIYEREPNHIISNQRKRFMQNAWVRKLRQETFVDACIFFAMDLEKTRQIVKSDGLLQEIINDDEDTHNQVLQYVLKDEPDETLTAFFQDDDMIPTVDFQQSCEPEIGVNHSAESENIASTYLRLMETSQTPDNGLGSNESRIALVKLRSKTLLPNELYVAIQAAELDVFQFAKTVQFILGFQPVPSTARKVVPKSGSEPDLSEDGYLAQCIAWLYRGNEQDGDYWLFAGSFGNEVAKGHANALVTLLQKAHCREVIDLHKLAVTLCSKRKLPKTFSNKYHNRSIPPTEDQGAAENLFTLSLPKYNVSQVPNAGNLPDTRRLAMERGWRLKRLHDYSCVYVMFYLEQILNAQQILSINIKKKLKPAQQRQVRLRFANKEGLVASTPTLYTLFYDDVANT